MEHPSKKTLVDTLEYKMAKPDGTLLGEGLSDTKENKLFYKENFVFKNSGQYKVTIQQAVRQSGKIEGIEKLDGITEVGFRIEKQE
jgi:gliding motility-associated lipoprotein GldH